MYCNFTHVSAIPDDFFGEAGTRIPLDDLGRPRSRESVSLSRHQLIALVTLCLPLRNLVAPVQLVFRRCGSHHKGRYHTS